MHRFCGTCIERWLRACAPENTCPSCREPLGSRRAARADARFDAVVAALYGDVDLFENGESSEGAAGKKALEAAVEEGKAVGRAIKAAAAERVAARKQGRSSGLPSVNNDRTVKLSAPPAPAAPAPVPRPAPVAAQQIVARPPRVASQVIYQQQQQRSSPAPAANNNSSRGRGRPRKVNVATLAASLAAAGSAPTSTSSSSFTFLVPGLVPVVPPVEGQRHPSVAAGPDAMPRPVPAAVPTAAAVAALGPIGSGGGGEAELLALNDHNKKRAPSTDTNVSGDEMARGLEQPQAKKKRRSGTRPTKAQKAAAEAEAAAAAAAAVAAANQPRAPPVVLIVSRPPSAVAAAGLPSRPPPPPSLPPSTNAVPYSNPTPAQEVADAARARARSDAAAARELAVCGGGALFVTLAAAKAAGASCSSASSLPRPHALAPALAPASSLAALVAAQLEEGGAKEGAGGRSEGKTPVGALEEKVCLSLSPSGARDEGDEALFGAGSSATIADIAAAVLERQKNRKKGGSGGIHDALGPLRVWYSVGVEQ